MDNRTLAPVAAALTVLFIVLNFTVEGAGTLFLVLTVIAGLATGFFAAQLRKP